MSTTTAITSTIAIAPAPPGQPDMSYHPDIKKWQARTARRLQQGGLPKSLPPGFPEKLSGDLVWEGQTVAETYNWTYVLSTEQLDEIERAIVHFKGLNQPLGAISQETFPLPTLHAELRRLSRELHNGHGFFVLRGLRVVEDDGVTPRPREDCIIAYAGVSSHVAPQRGRQAHKYDDAPANVMLAHIKDLTGSANRGSGGGGGGEDKEKQETKKRGIGSPAYTADKQVFHTDQGDIVSLFALDTSASGGASKLASTWRVYNELAATRPDLVHTLSEDWNSEVFEKSSPTDKLYTRRPLIFHFPSSAEEGTPERIALQYARRYFVGFGALPRNPNIPPITEAQAEALDTLHFLGERFCVDTDFSRGDMQYVNNLAVFHARDGFVDTPEKQRHLLRLWLRDPEYAWKTPSVLDWRWDQIYKGITPESQVFPLEPYIASSNNKNR